MCYKMWRICCELIPGVWICHMGKLWVVFQYIQRLLSKFEHITFQQIEYIDGCPSYKFDYRVWTCCQDWDVFWRNVSPLETTPAPDSEHRCVDMAINNLVGFEVWFLWQTSYHENNMAMVEGFMSGMKHMHFSMMVSANKVEGDISACPWTHVIMNHQTCSTCMCLMACNNELQSMDRWEQSDETHHVWCNMTLEIIVKDLCTCHSFSCWAWRCPIQGMLLAISLLFPVIIK